MIALPAPHCDEVAVYDGKHLIKFLSRREALDLAASLIKSNDLLAAPADAQETAHRR